MNTGTKIDMDTHIPTNVSVHINPPPKQHQFLGFLVSDTAITKIN